MSDLSDLELAELKTAFALFDQSGDGRIDSGELRSLLESLLQEAPTDEEVNQLMRLMDRNNDGHIELDEFISSMREWLGVNAKALLPPGDKFDADFQSGGMTSLSATGDSMSSPLSGRKRKEREGDEERREVHKRIKAFLVQFRRNYDQLGVIRGKLRELGDMTEEDGDILGMEGFRLQFSSEEKVRFLADYRRTFTLAPQLTRTLDAHRSGALHASGGLDTLHEAIKCIADMLSIVEHFCTPVERRGIADDVVRIFEFCTQQNLVTHWVKCLNYTNAPALQHEAARSIAYFAPGPRIASTPPDSLLHPSNMFFKKICISEGCVPALKSLLRAQVPEVRERCAVALGAVAAYDAEARDYVLASDVLRPLMALINQQAPLSTVRAVTWTMSILCGHTHSLKRLPPWEAVSSSVEKQALVLFCDDEQSIANACQSLRLLLPGLPELAVDRRLAELLRDERRHVQLSALSVIESIAAHDEAQLHLLVHRCDLLTGLKHMLKSTDAEIRLHACRALCTLANHGTHLQALIDSHIVSLCVALLKVDEHVRFAVARLFLLLSGSTPAQVRHLVAEHRIVRELCAALTHFKVYDPVLIALYRYGGPTFNFQFVRTIVTALDNVVNVGEMEAEEEGGGINSYALAFDAECIDKLRSLLRDVRDGGSANIDAWRLRAQHDQSLEEKVQLLLFKLKRAHSFNEANSAQSVQVSALISEVWAEFFESGAEEAHDASSTLLLKCYMDEDIRVVQVEPSIAYDELRDGLCFKYDCDAVHIAYADADNELVTLDNDEALRTAVRLHAESDARCLRLHVRAVALEEATPQYVSSAMARINAGAAANAAGSASATSTAATTGGGAKLERRNSEAVDGRLRRSEALNASIGTAPAEIGADAFSFNKQAVVADELRLLASETPLSVAEIEDLRSQFASRANDRGLVTRDAFEQAMTAVGVTDPLLIEQLFSAFDRDGDGTIDLKEFIVGVGVLTRGTDEQKLRLMFDAYDVNGDGTLDAAEVRAIYAASLSYGGVHFASLDEEQRAIGAAVRQCFEQFDADRNGALSFDEFVNAVRSDALVIAAVRQYPSPLV